MGVRGLTTVLEQHGWIPSRKGCMESLWRDDSTPIDRIERLRPGSTLAIDGNGLTFYLFDVAYSRHWTNLGMTHHGNSGEKNCTCKQELTEEIIVQCLPQSVPLQLLDQVAREFAHALISCGMKLVVYWDGEIRRFKGETTKERRAFRAQQWTNLHQYCQFGTLPFPKPCCRRNVQSAFPTPSLITEQLQSTISSISGIEHVHCAEEADAEVARASSSSAHTFCVGMDSDYWLFRDTKYIPLSTLHVSFSVNIVTASVMTRDEVSSLLHLPCSESLVELGILLGNDYIKKGETTSDSFKSADAAIEFLQSQAGDYQVTTKSEKVQLTLDFIRALYSLEPLDDFAIDSTSEKEEDDNTDHPKLPVSFNLSLLALGPFEFSVRNVALRPLQAYVDLTTDSDSQIVTKEHLDTFVELIKALELNLDKRMPSARTSIQRPKWPDVLASYVIEKVLSYIWSNYRDAPMVRYSAPMKMFDALSFHNIMRTARIVSEEQTVKAVPFLTGINVNGNNVSNFQRDKPSEKPVEALKLPIDEFEEDILRTIKNHRVTIIQGETGCGKSSRVPVMILREPVPHDALSEVKIFVSQPRRIAAKALVERVRSCEPALKDKIALRMGHGEREYETAQTRAWFVTTGYLVRVLANHPERFNDVSHLIIDEVHERSVDSDIICLLCKRLLTTNKHIRLVLMSATMASRMYAEYFNASEPPIKVGGRRFPIKEYFVEDLVSTFKFSAKDQKTVKEIKDHCEKTKCRVEPSNTYMKSLYQLAVRTTAAVGQTGSSVLIFVPGMHDIVSINDLIEQIYVPGARFTCFPIHSDVPFDEQMAAFDKPADDEIKVIIGTNAAESSITLPDVDHVICLGLQKHIVYNPASHRQLLTPAWISQASAIQRAGRTGRVRNGNVYRLYTRKAFESYMSKFEIGEMSRVPLDSVILDLKQMLHEEATPVLLECLEPPELRTIERSFESLHKQKFLTCPDDSGDITNLGSFVARIGIDLMLGSLIGLGIQFGVGAEAIEIAAILSFSKSPWVLSNPLYHEASEFNDITSKTFTSRCHFDANLYSEPFAIMNVIWDYEMANNKGKFGWTYGLALARVKRLVSTRNSIRSRVTEFIGGDSSRFVVKDPPSLMPHAKAVLLRIVLVWVLHDNLIKSFQVPNAADDSVAITLRKNLIKEEQLRQVLDESRHPYRLVTHQETEQMGTFIRYGHNVNFDSFLTSFETRFISYCAECDFKMAWYRVDSDSLVLFVLNEVSTTPSFKQIRDDVLAGFAESSCIATANVDSNLRGINGRPCGLWKVEPLVREKNVRNGAKSLTFARFATNAKGKILALAKFLKIKSLQTAQVEKTLLCHFFIPKAGKKKADKAAGFSLFTRGQCDRLSKADVLDLFSTSEVAIASRESAKPTQEVQFKIVPNVPLSQSSSNKEVDLSSSWSRQLLNDIPEGARIMSVIASNRRGADHGIIFTVPDDGGDTLVKVEMSRTESKIGERWKSFYGENNVFVEVNSVPAASLCLDGPVEVFAVAGDSLELKGGALRVSGLSLLPPGRLFLLLCLKSFGIHPTSRTFGDDDEELDQCLSWLQDAKGKVTLGNVVEHAMAERVMSAIQFHESCCNLGENLVCYPEFVVKLLSIFDQVDGYPCLAWDGLFESENQDGVVQRNSRPNSAKKKATIAEASGVDLSTSSVGQLVDAGPETKHKKKKKKKPATKSANQELKVPQVGDGLGIAPKKKSCEGSLLIQFSNKARKLSAGFFASELASTNSANQSALPSTNILALLVATYREITKSTSNPALLDEAVAVPPQWAVFAELAQASTKTHNEPLSLTPSQWRVFRVKGNNGKDWYSAAFIGSLIPLLPLNGRGGIKEWMKDEIIKPIKSDDALRCVPPNVATELTHWTTQPKIDGSIVEPMVLFPTMETALRMAAAYWLERQFCDDRRHWYQVELQEMKQQITQLA